MMRYPVQPRDQIFGKSYVFLSFANNMGKNIGENISKNVSGKFSQKFLDHAKQSATDVFYLKLLQKEQFKKQQKQLVIWLVIKFLIKSKKFLKIHSKIIYRQLQMRMIKKCLKNDTYLQKKNKKLLMIWD